MNSSCAGHWGGGILKGRPRLPETASESLSGSLWPSSCPLESKPGLAGDPQMSGSDVGVALKTAQILGEKSAGSRGHAQLLCLRVSSRAQVS